MRRDLPLRSRLTRAAAGALMLLPAACASPTGPAVMASSVTPVATGIARIWFYREYEPSVSINDASVALNGTPVGTVRADGSALYRDVPAGHYHVTVVSYGMDVNQAKDIDLGPGQEGYVKILSLSSWESGGDQTQIDRDTFYVSLVPPQVARGELVNHPLSGG